MLIGYRNCLNIVKDGRTCVCQTNQPSKITIGVIRLSCVLSVLGHEKLKINLIIDYISAVGEAVGYPRAIKFYAQNRFSGKYREVSKSIFGIAKIHTMRHLIHRVRVRQKKQAKKYRCIELLSIDHKLPYY